MLAWDIGLDGRRWKKEELADKVAAIPARIEVINGQLLWTEEDRLTLLAMLLEHVGMRAAVQLGDLASWRAAVAVPDFEQPVRSGRTWNYRVMSFKQGDEAWQAVHEVHYKDGVPIAYSATPAVLLWHADDGDDAGFQCLDRMRVALSKPVLTEGDFKSAE